MNNLDKFLVGLNDSYEFAKYGEQCYSYARLVCRDRFVLLYEVDLSNVLRSYHGDASFRGFFDKQTEILYVDSEYYSTLYNESELDKRTISNLQKEMEKIVSKRYMDYIKDKQEYLKQLARQSFEEFYSIEGNMKSLREEMEMAVKDNTPLDYFPNFGIKTPMEVNDIFDYITDNDTFINKTIKAELGRDGVRIYSYYSGVRDITVTQREYIGFMLLKQQKINVMAKDVMNNKDERSHILKKLRSIKEFINNNGDIKNIVIGLSYEDKEIEITYPLGYLQRLELETYHMPVKDREKFYDVFCGFGYDKQEQIMDAIQYFKYRNKVVWEANKGE